MPKASEQPKFAVGDTAIVTSVNRGREYQGTVTKVGRKLITVTNKWGQSDVFRLDTGAKNDAYQHERVWTLDERAEHEARSHETKRLHGHGLRFDRGVDKRITIDGLRRIADLLDDLNSKGI